MNKPNFFIVGAPKSGTSALYEYLRHHPNVFMPLRKEPNYFATDFPENCRGVRSLKEYLHMFKPAKEHHPAIGEASASYLSSKEAIRNIHTFDNKSRIIAMVRNPIDLSHSYHGQLCFSLDEDIEDFETAWRLQKRRKKGLDIPELCLNPDFLQYSEYAMLGRQIQRIVQYFPKKQVITIVFDDFKADTIGIYKSVLEFLEIPHDGRTVFPKINVRKTSRFKFISRIIKRPPSFLFPVRNALKKLLGRKSNLVARKISSLLSKPLKRKDLSMEFRRELASFFKEDVMLLSDLLKRDLSHWMICK